MVRVHVRLDLEDEAGHFGFVRLDRAARRGLRSGAGREFGHRVDQVPDAEILKRAAEQHWGHVALEEGLLVEGLQALDREMEFVDGLPSLVLGQKTGDLRVIGTGDGDRIFVLAEARQPLQADVVGAGERAPAANRPRKRRRIERQCLLDLVEEVERIARLAVHLVDEGDGGNVAQAADLEEFARARLDALGGVDHHHRRVDGGQRAIGVLGKILVPRRVEQIEDAIGVFEGHDRGDDRNAALALDAHPVGAGFSAVGLGAHFARELDGAAEEEDLLGESCLAGVRVGDDRKSAPARDGVLFRHGSLGFGGEGGAYLMRMGREGKGKAPSRPQVKRLLAPRAPPLDLIAIRKSELVL